MIQVTFEWDNGMQVIFKTVTVNKKTEEVVDMLRPGFYVSRFTLDQFHQALIEAHLLLFDFGIRAM